MSHVYVCDFARTAIGRYGGSLSTIRTDDLAAEPIKALLKRNPSIDPGEIDDVIFGCANQAGEDNRNVARMASLIAHLPVSVSASTINRLCGSGMDAIITAGRAIKAGEADLLIAGGVESMSRAPFVMPKAETSFSRAHAIYDTTIGWRFINPRIDDEFGTDSMPETAENVAADFGISRADQDSFALRSQQKAAAAKNAGRHAREIIPVAIPQKGGMTKDFDQDEHSRPGTTLDQLSKLPTPFRKGGTVTAGNASGVNDGAAAVIIASEVAVTRFGLSPIARITSGVTAGVEPRIMGIGPVPSTRKLCERLGVTIGAFDIIELNEAFAAQALAVLRELGLPDDSDVVNPNGGAIALGHPIGMSGVRIVGTAAMELHDRKANRALATMCIGVGQGISIAIEAA